MRRIQDLAADEHGGTAIEYGLICALVVIAMMAALHSVAGQAIRIFGHVEAEVKNASSSVS